MSDPDWTSSFAPSKSDRIPARITEAVSRGLWALTRYYQALNAYNLGKFERRQGNICQQQFDDISFAHKEAMSVLWDRGSKLARSIEQAFDHPAPLTSLIDLPSEYCLIFHEGAVLLTRRMDENQLFFTKQSEAFFSAGPPHFAELILDAATALGWAVD